MNPHNHLVSYVLSRESHSITVCVDGSTLLEQSRDAHEILNVINATAAWKDLFIYDGDCVVGVTAVRPFWIDWNAKNCIKADESVFMTAWIERFESTMKKAKTYAIHPKKGS